MPKTFFTPRSSFFFLAALIVGAIIRFSATLVAPSLDKKWSPPVLVSQIDESFSGFTIHRWNNEPIGIQSGKAFYFLGQDGRWLEKPSPQLNGITFYPVAIDPVHPNAFFCQLEYTNKKAPPIESLLKVTLTQEREIAIEKKVSLDVVTGGAFKETNSRPGFRREISLMCGNGSANGVEVCLPFSAHIQNVTERMTSAGILQTGYSDAGGEYGIFQSDDGGSSWQMRKLNPIEAFATIRRTSGERYLLTTEVQSKLFISSQPLDATEWRESKLLCDTLKGGFLAEAHDDTLHLCWMDMRLKKGIGFFIFGDWDVGQKNNQVFYRNLKDGGAIGAKERKLSGSLSYCGAPTMSVEGRKIVVAWEHYLKPYTRAAIYYVTSKNNGRTWSRVQRVETFSQSTAEKPVVILHNNVIHLFYDRTEWPKRRCDLIHQERPFPEK